MGRIRAEPLGIHAHRILTIRHVSFVLVMTLDILHEADEAVAHYREEKQLEDDDENQSEPEYSEDSRGDSSEPEQLTGRVPCIHRSPIRYHPSTDNHVQCVLELLYSDHCTSGVR